MGGLAAYRGSVTRVTLPLRLDRRVASRRAEHIPAALGAAPSSDSEMADPIARVDSDESLASELGDDDEQVLNLPQLREHAEIFFSSPEDFRWPARRRRPLIAACSELPRRFRIFPC